MAEGSTQHKHLPTEPPSYQAPSQGQGPGPGRPRGSGSGTEADTEAFSEADPQLHSGHSCGAQVTQTASCGRAQRACENPTQPHPTPPSGCAWQGAIRPHQLCWPGRRSASGGEHLPMVVGGEHRSQLHAVLFCHFYNLQPNTKQDRGHRHTTSAGSPAHKVGCPTGTQGVPGMAGSVRTLPIRPNFGRAG